MPLRFRSVLPTAGLVALFAAAPAGGEKQTSAFFPASLVAQARENVARQPWAAAIRDEIVKAAEPWMGMSDDELWSLQFGHTITRSWMVWSNGHCPACKEGVPMYNWVVKALDRPWKMQCPHCKELFPKNDFAAFYRSGLDEHNVFDPKRADRKLLFNAEHADPADPLHLFGVDDGEGYVEGDKRWRFIGAYLIYGQWKQAIVAGAQNLAEAYVITGDARSAHKAAVLLDRAADVYPTFDFKTEGLVYEVPGVAGYVSTWHDACVETRQLVLAYDMILPALLRDSDLQRFLAAKAAQFKLENRKLSIADIRRNIEDRILKDCQTSRAKINSNYPQTDITIAFAKTALAWPENRDEVGALIADIVKGTTAVDGTSGEKGMSGYSAMAIQGLGNLLAMYSRMDPGFLPDLFKQAPRLHQAFRFHMNAWCLQRYYPSCGDSGSYCAPTESYVSVGLNRSASMSPSMFSFLWQLYDQTQDSRFVQALYLGNGSTLDGLPHDLFCARPEAFQADVKQIIARVGTRIPLPTVNNEEWRLALLRSGTGDDERVLWLDYDSGGRHSHCDGMNLGLYARGLDLMPDFGYPPVQYGGWGAPRAQWYVRSMAHNTVVVDGGDTKASNGKTTLWADGKQFHAIGATCPEMVGGRYERTAALVDIGPENLYVIDVFRVAGGSDHCKFFRSHFGTLTTRGVPGTSAKLFENVPHMRNWTGGAAEPGWSVEWKVDDQLELLARPADLRVRYTDLTADAQAYTGESWVSVCQHGFTSNSDAWVPHVVSRRHADAAPLASTFVSVIEPFETKSNITAMRRLSLQSSDGRPCGDADVAVELTLTDGSRDLYIARDGESKNPSVTEPQSGLTLDGDLCLVRFRPSGEAALVCLGKARAMKAGPLAVELAEGVEYVELTLDGDAVRVLTGEPDRVKSVMMVGRKLDVR